MKEYHHEDDMLDSGERGAMGVRIRHFGDGKGNAHKAEAVHE
jgi:hypothetical protein